MPCVLELTSDFQRKEAKRDAMSNAVRCHYSADQKAEIDAINWRTKYRGAIWANSTALRRMVYNRQKLAFDQKAQLLEDPERAACTRTRS